jgi:cation transport ATPase
MNITKKLFLDSSLLVLFASNILSIIMAVVQNWDMSEILWVYWGQSVIIGVVNFFRIWQLKEFSTDNFKMNGRRPKATTSTKRQSAIFFLFHYGFFHFVYAIFLWTESPLNAFTHFELFTLMALVFGFIGCHGYSYRHNLQADFKHKKPNIGTLMFYPYCRIIPMHIIIIVGPMIASQSALLILFFMGMKTLADAAMHMIEHHMFRKPGEDVPPTNDDHKNADELIDIPLKKKVKWK